MPLRQATTGYHRLRGDQPSLLDYLRAAPDLDALELDRARTEASSGPPPAECQHDRLELTPVFGEFVDESAACQCDPADHPALL